MSPPKKAWRSVSIDRYTADRSKALFVTSLIGFALPVFAQQAGPAKPSFEIASVKPSVDSDVRTFGPRPGGRFIAVKCTLKTVIALAYNVREDMVTGGPGWVAADRWNIEAKAEEGIIPAGEWPDPARPDHPLTLMLQSLLEDRFHVKVRRETKEAPVYELVVAKGGPKLKSTAGAERVDRTVPRGMMRLNPGLGYLAGNGIPVVKLAGILAEPGVLGHPVIDQTQLTGSYDFVLEWAPDPNLTSSSPDAPQLTPAAAASRPSIFSALKEQLGLKVESTKGPVAAAVVEHAEKPGAN
jgi:uncharacterized protein (TIGR03435 family)